jgi:hypothetical protein
MRMSFLLSGFILNVAMVMAQGSLTSTQQHTSGVVGITTGQTARLNVLYPSVPAPILQILCSATLVIADDQGKILKSQDAQQLIGGKSVSLDLNADTDLPSGANRVQIHALTLTPNPGCTLVPTLEIFDNATGKTVVVVGSKVTWPRPQPVQIQGSDASIAR